MTDRFTLFRDAQKHFELHDYRRAAKVYTKLMDIDVAGYNIYAYKLALCYPDDKAKMFATFQLISDIKELTSSEQLVVACYYLYNNVPFPFTLVGRYADFFENLIYAWRDRVYYDFLDVVNAYSNIVENPNLVSILLTMKNQLGDVSLK